MEGENGNIGEQMEQLVRQLWECGVTYGESVREFKRRLITQALISNRGNQCKAAREIGIHRNTLLRQCQELNIDIWSLKGFRPKAALPAAKTAGACA